MDKGRCYLALGSNLGDKRANLSRAVSLIRERVGRVVCLSRFYETEPWGYASANTYLNAALEVETTLSPQEVLVITDVLTLPHPLMHERLFVMEPMVEIAPTVMHPVLQKTICEIYNALML